MSIESSIEENIRIRITKTARSEAHADVFEILKKCDI